MELRINYKHCFIKTINEIAFHCNVKLNEIGGGGYEFI